MKVILTVMKQLKQLSYEALLVVGRSRVSSIYTRYAIYIIFHLCECQHLCHLYLNITSICMNRLHVYLSVFALVSVLVPLSVPLSVSVIFFCICVSISVCVCFLCLSVCTSFSACSNVSAFVIVFVFAFYL